MGVLKEFLSIRREYRTLQASMRMNAGVLRSLPVLNQQYKELLVRVKTYHKNHFYTADLLPDERADWINILVELDIVGEVGVVTEEVVSN